MHIFTYRYPHYPPQVVDNYNGGTPCWVSYLAIQPITNPHIAHRNQQGVHNHVDNK